MLYKKYHRSYVSRFKKGTKIEIFYSNDVYTTDSFINSKVIREPFVDYYSCSVSSGISIVDSCGYKWVVVYHSGKISYRINIKENAI